VWVPTQQITSIAKPFQENVATTILFYTPLANTTKAVFKDNVCGLYKVRTVQSAHFKTQGTEVRSPCVLPPAPLRDKNGTQLKFAPNLILLLRWIYTNHLYKKRSFIPEEEITATTMEDVMNLVQAEAFTDVSDSTRNILALHSSCWYQQVKQKKKSAYSCHTSR